MNTPHDEWSLILQKINELLARPDETYESVGKLLGVGRSTVYNWVHGGRGGKRVSYENMVKYKSALGLESQGGPGESEPPSWKRNVVLGNVPVVSLADCGLGDDWYEKRELQITAPRPPEYWDNPEIFATLASGTSMIPAGISPGFICYCDPRSVLDKGDAVLLERKDGSVNIKLYLGEDGPFVRFQGWLAPDAKGDQKKFIIKEPASQIKSITPIVYVKRKF